MNENLPTTLCSGAVEAHEHRPQSVQERHEPHESFGENTTAKMQDEVTREKLLFLLKVASSPSLTEKESKAPCASLPNLPRVSQEVPKCKSEEDEKRQRRVQYALNVLTGSPVIREARTKKATEENTRKKPSSDLSSIADNIQGMPNKEQKIGRIVPKVQISSPDSYRQKPKLPSSLMHLSKILSPESMALRQSHAKPRRQTHTLNFAEKLMDVLSRPECEGTISWLPHGDAFVIISPKQFTDEVLPRFFKVAKFESFVRKLNRWGFRRTTKGTDALAYTHELFIRGRPDLCKKMSGGVRKNDPPSHPFSAQADTRLSSTMDSGLTSAPNQLTSLSAEHFRLRGSNAPERPIPQSHSRRLMGMIHLLQNAENRMQHPADPKTLLKMKAQESLAKLEEARTQLRMEEAKILCEQAVGRPANSQKDLGSNATEVGPILSLNSALAMNHIPNDVSLSTNSALAIYCDRKVRQIAARYAWRAAAARGTKSALPTTVPPHNLAAAMSEGAGGVAGLLRADEERISYLHHIRENLEMEGGVIGSR